MLVGKTAQKGVLDDNVIIITLVLQNLFESDFSSPLKRIKACKALINHCKGPPLLDCSRIADISKSNRFPQSKQKNSFDITVTNFPTKLKLHHFSVFHQIMTIRRFLEKKGFNVHPNSVTLLRVFFKQGGELRLSSISI